MYYFIISKSSQEPADLNSIIMLEGGIGGDLFPLESHTMKGANFSPK